MTEEHLNVVEVCVRFQQPACELAPQIVEMQIANLGPLTGQFPRSPNRLDRLAHFVSEHVRRCGVLFPIGRMTTKLKNGAQVWSNWNHPCFGRLRLCGRQHEPAGLPLFATANLEPLQR